MQLHGSASSDERFVVRRQSSEVRCGFFRLVLCDVVHGVRGPLIGDVQSMHTGGRHQGRRKIRTSIKVGERLEPASMVDIKLAEATTTLVLLKINRVFGYPPTLSSLNRTGWLSIAAVF